MSDKLDKLQRKMWYVNVTTVALILITFVVTAFYIQGLTQPLPDLAECHSGRKELLEKLIKSLATERKCLELMTDAAGALVICMDERDEARGVVGVICGPDAGFWE